MSAVICVLKLQGKPEWFVSFPRDYTDFGGFKWAIFERFPYLKSRQIFMFYRDLTGDKVAISRQLDYCRFREQRTNKILMVTDSIKSACFDIFPGYFERPLGLDISSAYTATHEKLEENSMKENNKIKKNLLEEIKKMLDRNQETDARKFTNGILHALLNISSNSPCYLERVEKEIKVEIDKRANKLITSINTLLMETCSEDELKSNLEVMKRRINRNREIILKNCINDIRQEHRENPEKKCDYYVDMSIVTDIETRVKKLTATTESLIIAQDKNNPNLTKMSHLRNEKKATETTTDDLKKVRTQLLELIDIVDLNSKALQVNLKQVNNLVTKSSLIKPSSTLKAVKTTSQDENESNLSKWRNKKIPKTRKISTKQCLAEVQVKLVKFIEEKDDLTNQLRLSTEVNNSVTNGDDIDGHILESSILDASIEAIESREPYVNRKSFQGDEGICDFVCEKNLEVPEISLESKKERIAPFTSANDSEDDLLIAVQDKTEEDSKRQEETFIETKKVVQNVASGAVPIAEKSPLAKDCQEYNEIDDELCELSCAIDVYVESKKSSVQIQTETAANKDGDKDSKCKASVPVHSDSRVNEALT